MIKKCEFCNKKFNVKPSRFEKAKYCSKQCMYSSNIKNLKDKRFGKLVVKEYAFRKNNYAMWLCECDCGKTKIVSSNSLNSGKCQSCGCLLVETLIKRNTKHNKTNTKYIKYNNNYYRIKELAKILNIKEDCLRKRISRNKLKENYNAED